MFGGTLITPVKARAAFASGSSLQRKKPSSSYSSSQTLALQGSAFTSAQQRTQARVKALQFERFRQIVIRPGIESFHPVRHVATGGQEQHRQRLSALFHRNVCTTSRPSKPGIPISRIATALGVPPAGDGQPHARRSTTVKPASPVPAPSPASEPARDYLLPVRDAYHIL